MPPSIVPSVLQWSMLACLYTGDIVCVLASNSVFLKCGLTHAEKVPQWALQINSVCEETVVVVFTEERETNTGKQDTRRDQDIMVHGFRV